MAQIGFYIGAHDRLGAREMQPGTFYVTMDQKELYLDVKDGVSGEERRIHLNPTAAEQGALMPEDMDAAPTEDSANPVTSGGVYAALEDLRTDLRAAIADIPVIPDGEQISF